MTKKILLFSVGTYVYPYMALSFLSSGIISSVWLTYNILVACRNF